MWPVIAFAAACAALLITLFLANRGEGVTPLMKAAKSGNVVEIKVLVEKGAKVDAQSRYGWTALMFAAWQGHEDAVRILLEAGADPEIKSGGVPSRFQTVGGHPPSSALHESVRNDHLHIAKSLVNAGAGVDAGAVALAGRSGDLDFLAFLNDHGADWNVASGNAFHASPLCGAASVGKLAAVRWLIEHGANPNLVAVGQTALKEAVINDEVEIVEFLLQHGANPNLVYGSTEEFALFTAVTKFTTDRDYAANLSIIRLLLEHGSDQTQRAFNGQHTALELIRTQRANTEKYLLDTTTEETRRRLVASVAHTDAVIDILEPK